ncbi:MAG: restriction endonuclease subunit S [Bacteroidales bacterium]|nr:restriction endonuclease subunit S [Bacteroidales bacterium]
MEKQTKIGTVCSNFDTFQLKSVLVKNDAGDWGSEPDKDAIGVIRSTNFNNDGKLDLSDIAYRTLSKRKFEEKKLYASDILIERSGGSETQPVGRVGLITDEIAETDYAFANFIQRISLNDNVNAKFVYYCLQQMYEMGITAGMQSQTTGIRNLDWKQYIKVLLPKPSISEQSAIAAILSKVDEAIASVQASISAAERLKKSLMQNLLTGRMKPDGTLRKEDEFYLDEKFGRVPKGWRCDKFKEFAVLQRGSDLTDNDVVPGIYPVVKSNGVSISHNQYFVEPPGVVTGRSGTIGKAFYIEEKFWAHNTTLYVKDFKGNVPKYIYYLILSMDFSRYYAGTTVPTLNRNDIHKLKVAIPETFEEQQQIALLLDESHNIINKKRNKIAVLERLKKSLMQNLLTGKVRVK